MIKTNEIYTCLFLVCFSECFDKNNGIERL